MALDNQEQTSVESVKRLKWKSGAKKTEILESDYKRNLNYIKWRLKRTFYQHLRQCTEKAKQSEGHETICFDFEQNFPFPHLSVGDILYKRQLWFYNFSPNQQQGEGQRSHILPESLYPNKGASYCETFRSFQRWLSGTESQPHYATISVHTCRPKSVSKHHLPSADTRAFLLAICDRQFAVI